MHILLIIGFMLNFTQTNTIVTVNLHNQNPLTQADSMMSGFPSENYHPFAPLTHFKETWEVFPAQKGIQATRIRHVVPYKWNSLH